MQDEIQLKQAALERLGKLNSPELRQVLGFMDFLLDHPTSQAKELKAPPGTVQDLLAVAGSWEFEPGELEEILQDIEQSRLMELEESYDDSLLV